MPHVLPLEGLAVGECGRVLSVDGDDGPVHRLQEMGLRRGVEVRMVRPGRPCIVAVGQHRISYRSEGTTIVLVELTDQPTTAGVN